MFVFEAFLFFVINYIKYLAFFLYFYLSGRAFNLIIHRFYKNIGKHQNIILNVRKEILYPVLGLIFSGNLLIFLNYFIELKNNLIFIILLISLLPNFLELKINPNFNKNNLIYFF